MPAEVELKLAVSPPELPVMARLRWLQKLATAPASKKQLVSVYFDTRKLKLRNHGLTLRIRQVGGRRIQTIKQESNGSTGALGRGEWEEEIASESPNVKGVRGTPLEPLATSKLRKSLRPIFETNIRRTALPLHLGNSELEVAFDRGRIIAGTRKATVSEIEIELKQGNHSDLAQLAARLVEAGSARYLTRSKAARGYALRLGTGDEPVFGSKIVLDSQGSAGAAFSAIGLSCLHHFASNEGAVGAELSEGVHQMRVGLRRLRAAISIFKTIVGGEETERIKHELKWLTEQLGPARDFDVLVAEGVRPLKKANPDQLEVTVLEDDLSERRAAGLQRAKTAVESDRYRNLVIKTALWAIDGEWLRSRDAQQVARRRGAVQAYAEEVLEERTKKIGKKVKKLEELSAARRHKLRIAVKKLRYATEFFDSLFAKSKGGKARKRFRRLLKALQDALGKLNDISVHEGVAREFTRPKKRSGKRPQKAFAMGLLAGQELHEAQACSAAAMKAGRALVKTPAFR